MIDYDLIFVLLSIVIGGSITIFVYIPKEERSKLVDLWLGMSLMFLLGYKLLPVLDSPKMILKPIQLLMLKSGDIGLLLGFLFSFLYWVFVQIRLTASLKDSLGKMIILLASSYTILSLIHFEVYQGQYLGLYRAGIGLLFLLLIKYKPQLMQYFLVLYGGLLLVIESLAFSHLYWGLSLIQWMIFFVMAYYLLLSILQRKGRSDWQEK